MDPFTAALVLASAAPHPLWYALVKRDPDPDAAFIGRNAGLALIAFVHALLRGVPLGSALGAWPLLLVSVCAQIAYGLAIVLVLKRGDLSAYYPAPRPSPLAIVALSFLVLGERYRPVLLAGIALVLAGTFALPYRRGARLLAGPPDFGLAGPARVPLSGGRGGGGAAGGAVGRRLGAALTIAAGVVVIVLAR